MKHALAALAVLAALAAPWARADDPATFASRPEVQSFIRELVERHAFDAGELHAVFSRARREEAVLTAVQTQPEALARSWADYRATFVNERLVRAGLAFWREHRSQLERARRTYGVPEEIIVAILGVETFYGRNTGRWRVIDALATLAFDYAPRAPYFRGELENYLLFAREMELDVFALKGSYAGAIGSVGNFLKQHGWRSGEPVQLGARVNGDGHGAYADGNPLPRHTLEELTLAGIESRGAPLPAGTRAALLELRSPERPAEYRLGLQNFYVLTRYNRAVFYAMAVSDLGEALRAARARPKPAAR